MSYKTLSQQIKQLNNVLETNYDHKSIQQALSDTLKCNTVLVSNTGTILSKTYAIASVKKDLFTEEESRVGDYIFKQLQQYFQSSINLTIADLIDINNKSKISTLSVIPLKYKEIAISYLIVYFEYRKFTEENLILLTLAGQLINQLLLTNLCLKEDIHKAIYDYDSLCYSRLINNSSGEEMNKTNLLLNHLIQSIINNTTFSITDVARSQKKDHKRFVKQMQVIQASGLVRHNKKNKFVISQVVKEKYNH